MHLYTVYENPDPLSDNELIFVSDKFSWLAFIFPILWPLLKGSWLFSILTFIIFGIGIYIIELVSEEGVLANYKVLSE